MIRSSQAAIDKDIPFEAQNATQLLLLNVKGERHEIAPPVAVCRLQKLKFDGVGMVMRDVVIVPKTGSWIVFLRSRGGVECYYNQLTVIAHFH